MTDPWDAGIYLHLVDWHGVFTYIYPDIPDTQLVWWYLPTTVIDP